uniref:Uncharacterized protein n=1 Tax=Anopheles atroparvus TaxID=41427 RepID=A0AAG5DLG0_ANOAO
MDELMPRTCVLYLPKRRQEQGVYGSRRIFIAEGDRNCTRKRLHQVGFLAAVCGLWISVDIKRRMKEGKKGNSHWLQWVLQ